MSEQQDDRRLAAEESRFWARVDRSGGPAACWPWTLSTNAGGYGQTTFAGKRQYVHRVAYYLTHGPLDINSVVDHRCHNRRCCNPAHLQLTDTRGNMQNRSGPQVNSRSGVRGVYRTRAGTWRAQIRVDGRNVSGGCYPTIPEAAEAARRLRATLMRNSLLDRAG